jgi:two-component system, NtrC family, sensor kinase
MKLKKKGKIVIMSVPNNNVILVVDDEPLNVKMMGALLSREGYQVLDALNGLEALVRVQNNPDLILMDIMMPGLDGFETCRRLKADEATRNIPVIFLSALQDSKTRTTGLNLGGVDFISKPFQRDELLARVRTHLTIRKQELQLREYAEDLESMVAERTAQLVHADRLATLGTLVAAVSHEINNPLQAVLGNTQLALMDLDEFHQCLPYPSNDSGCDSLKTLFGNMGNNLKEIHRGAQRLVEIIKLLKDFGKKETGRIERFPVIRPIREALAIMHPKLKNSVTTEIQVPVDAMVQGDRQQFSQIFINLVHNAFDALNGKAGKVVISAESDQLGQLIIDIKDSGLGIPEEVIPNIFEPFFTTKGEKEGTGLGLFITRQLIEKHQGSIQAVRHDGQGAWFRITFPQI